MSDVRFDIPSAETPTTQSLRDNFAQIAAELTAIQDVLFNKDPLDSPVFSGTIDAVNARFSGSIAPASILSLSSQTPTITAVAPLSNITGSILLTKWPDGFVRFAGKVTFDYTNTLPGTAYPLIANDGVLSKYRPDAVIMASSAVVPITILSGSYYTGFLLFNANGSVHIGWTSDRNTAAALVTGAAAVAYCSGSYDASGSV